MNKETEAEGIEKITLPRPGHEILVGAQNFMLDDIRPVIEELSSARETVCELPTAVLPSVSRHGIEIGGHVIRIGAAGYNSWEDARAQTDSSTG